jgi:purine nucleoside permease
MIWRLSGWSSTTKMRLLMPFLPAAFFIMAISTIVGVSHLSPRFAIARFAIDRENRRMIALREMPSGSRVDALQL